MNISQVPAANPSFETPAASAPPGSWLNFDGTLSLVGHYRGLPLPVAAPQLEASLFQMHDARGRGFGSAVEPGPSLRRGKTPRFAHGAMSSGASGRQRDIEPDLGADVSAAKTQQTGQGEPQPSAQRTGESSTRSPAGVEASGDAPLSSRGNSGSGLGSLNPSPGGTLGTANVGPSGSVVAQSAAMMTPQGSGSSPRVRVPLPDTGSAQNNATMARVVRGLQGALHQNGGSVTLRLFPPELGFVRIELEVTDGIVRAQLLAENRSVQSLLQQQMGHLHNALESHGLSVDRLEVQTLQQNSSSFNPDQSDDPVDDGRSRGQFSNLTRQQPSDEEPRDDPSQPSTFEQELNTVA